MRLKSVGSPVQVRSSAPYVPLAQLDRAFDYESKGQEFESLRAHFTRRYGGIGRRARLKIVRETVGVQVPLPAVCIQVEMRYPSTVQCKKYFAHMRFLLSSSHVSMWGAFHEEMNIIHSGLHSFLFCYR